VIQNDTPGLPAPTRRAAMKINQKKMVQVDIKTMEIYCKVSDRFTFALKDDEGETVYQQDDGYVPDFMPGQHSGDYIILNIDIDTGKIANWTPPSAEKLQKAIDKDED
jgi:hypothetical protein